MKPSSAALASILQPVPDELLRYFEQAADAGMYTQARHSQHLLRPEDAASHTHLIRYHSIVEVLGGIVLDDMQTSNHHLYISVGPLRGAVFFLSHDGDSRVVYSSLPAFLAAAVSACDQEQILEDIHPAHSPMASDQPGLSTWITDLLTLEQADVLVSPFVPSLDLADLRLLRRLATDSNFFVVESVALEIYARPDKELTEIAVLCTQHPHPQASGAGHRALTRIRAL